MMPGERKDKMSIAIALIIKQAIKMLVATDDLPKFDVFADSCGYTPDQLKKKLNGHNTIHYEDFLLMAEKIKEMDRSRKAYPFLIQRLFNDFELGVAA